jgi:hypothetical protein
MSEKRKTRRAPWEDEVEVGAAPETREEPDEDPGADEIARELEELQESRAEVEVKRTIRRVGGKLTPAFPAPELNIYQRLLGVESEISRVAKDAQVSREGGGYRYVSHDAVTAALHPLLVKWGIYSQPTASAWGTHDIGIRVGKGKDAKRVNVSAFWTEATIGFVNVDQPGEVVATKAIGFGFGEKAPGIAYSYAAKYAYLKAFCLEAGERELEEETDPAGGWMPEDDRHPGPEEKRRLELRQGARRSLPPQAPNGENVEKKIATKDGPPDCEICVGKIYKGQPLIWIRGTSRISHESCWEGGPPPPAPTRRRDVR